VGLDGIESLYLKVTVADMYAGEKIRLSNNDIDIVLMVAIMTVYQTASMLCFTPYILLRVHIYLFFDGDILIAFCF